MELMQTTKSNTNVTPWPTAMDTAQPIRPGTWVQISTPAYDGRVGCGFLRAVLETQLAFMSRGATLATPIPPDRIPQPPDRLDLSVAAKSGDGLIDRARAALVNDFLANQQATHLMFIDSDIEWQPDHIFRLLLMDREVACGAYRKRQDQVEFPLRLLSDSMRGLEISRDGAMRIKYAPTGFLMIKRSALLRMIAMYPERRCMVEGGGWTAPANQYAYDFWDTGVDTDGVKLSEDYGFCRLWRAIGGEVWLAPDIRLTHDGSKRYVGCLADYLTVPGAIPVPVTGRW